MADIIKSNKNHDKLCLNGYAYTIQHRVKTKIRWHCVKRSLLNCSASLTTDLLKNNPLLIKNHSHSADLNEISVTKCLAEMKVRFITFFLPNLTEPRLF